QPDVLAPLRHLIGRPRRIERLALIEGRIALGEDRVRQGGNRRKGGGNANSCMQDWPGRRHVASHCFRASAGLKPLRECKSLALCCKGGLCPGTSRSASAHLQLALVLMPIASGHRGCGGHRPGVLHRGRVQSRSSPFVPRSVHCSVPGRHPPSRRCPAVPPPPVHPPAPPPPAL